MTQIFTFDEFVTENQQEVLYQMEKTRDAQEKVPTDPNEALVRLYNGIKNDYSIQRYSLGWSDVTKAIEKKLGARSRRRTNNRSRTTSLPMLWRLPTRS